MAEALRRALALARARLRPSRVMSPTATKPTAPRETVRYAHSTRIGIVPAASAWKAIQRARAAMPRSRGMAIAASAASRFLQPRG